MAQRNSSGRIDRFAQMSKQEEIIAKKRQEILEKQRTTHLAKKVAEAQTLASQIKINSGVLMVDVAAAAAAPSAVVVPPGPAPEQKDNIKDAKAKKDEPSLIESPKPTTTTTTSVSATTTTTTAATPTTTTTTTALTSLTGKTGKISFGIKRNQPAPPAEQPPPKVMNSFCNDGSFLDHFKKILEKHEQPKPVPPALIIPEIPAELDLLETEAIVGEQQIQQNEIIEMQQAQQQQHHQQQQQKQQQQLQQQQHQQQQHQQQQQQILQQTIPPPPIMPASAAQFAFNSNLLQQQMMLPHPHHHSHHPQHFAQHQQLQQHIQQQQLHLHHQQLQQQQHQQQHQQQLQQQQEQQHLLHQQQQTLQQQQTQQQQQQTLPTTLPNFTPPPPQPVAGVGMPAAFFTTPSNAGAPPLPQLVPPPPPPTTMAAAAAAAAVAMLNPAAAVPSTVAPPPPPPPPQMPLALASLASIFIPAPAEPLQLNAIPAPKEFDLNAIPKPQLNLEAIQVPSVVISELQQQQQPPQHLQQQQQKPDNNDHNCIPASVEKLIDMVADNGDDYEDKIRAHKNELPPAMWFLYDKNCEQYYKYREQLNERRCKRVQQQINHRKLPPQLLQQHVHNHNSNENNYQQPKPQQEQQELHEATSSSSRATVGAVAPAAENAMEEEAASISAADKYDPEFSGGDVDSDDEYMRGMMDRNRDNIKRRIECRNELSEEERQERQAEEEEEERRRTEKKKLRKSRWGEKVDLVVEDSSSSGIPTTSNNAFGNQNKPILSTVTRTDPALLQYARLNYGSTQLTEDDWKKCEEHYKVNLLYQDMMRKRQEIDRLARGGKFKYEYDSDEDVDGGTWEHKLRCAEMDATQAWACALTKQSEGKHHIGDFLPPEELKKFMEQYEAKKNNRQPDLSDYKEYKLREDNIGFQMLQKLGWKQGQGLGQDGAGIVDPVNKGPQREGNQGLGVSSSATPEDCDNEYDAYRKRMMLAYRFRPNPLNNPRRAYY